MILTREKVEAIGVSRFEIQGPTLILHTSSMAMDSRNKTVEEDKEILFRIVTLNNYFQVCIYCQYIHLA